MTVAAATAAAAAGSASPERQPILRPRAPPQARPDRWHALWRQLLLAVVASLGFFGVGLVRGFSSPGVPSMRATDPDLLSVADAASWISSIPPLGAGCGSLAAGPLLQRLGPRRTLLLSAPLALAAWTALACAPSFGVALVARLATGVYAGLALPSAQVYVSECARPASRGALGSLPALFMAGGVLVAYALGAWLPWRALAAASAACPAVLLLLLLPLPESPAWLAGRGKEAAAAGARRWLGRSDPELAASSAAADKEDPHAPHAHHAPSSKGAFKMAALLRRPVLEPLALALALQALQQLSGVDSVVFYAVDILTSAGGALTPHAASALVGGVQLAANACALPLVDRAGRRPLLAASSAVCAASMAALGTYFHLKERWGWPDTGALGLVPVASLVVFMAGYSVGLCTLPHLLAAELLPAAQRGPLSAAAGAFNLFVMFAVIRSFPALERAVGSDTAFWAYALCSGAGVAFSLLLLPETKGRPLADIEELFQARAAKAQAEKRDKALQRDGTMDERSAKDPEAGKALELMEPKFIKAPDS